MRSLGALIDCEIPTRVGNQDETVGDLCALRAPLHDCVQFDVEVLILFVVMLYEDAGVQLDTVLLLDRELLSLRYK